MVVQRRHIWHNWPIEAYRSRADSADGNLAKTHDEFCRVHSQTHGWLSWTCDDEAAGNSGLSTRAEAVDTQIVS